MALNTHHKVMYADSCKELAGQNKSLLKEFVDKDAKTGEAVFFDTIDVGDEAVQTALANIPEQYRAAFESSGKTFADWLKMQTPHMNVELGRVMLAPEQLDFGHTFRSFDEMAQNGDPKSKKLRQAMRSIHRKEDAIILSALFAGSKMVGKDLGNLTAQAFPTSQILAVPDGVFNLATIISINEIYDNNFLTDQKKYCVISPKAKKSLINNSGDTITSKDFVDSGRYFSKGELPDVYGICFIVHPGVKDHIGTFDDAFVVFTEESVVLNQFKALETNLGQAETQRFQYIFYMEELLNAVRIDDKTVVQGTLGTA